MAEEKYLLEMTGITKEFPGVKALKGVELRVKPGEVHGLLGENGAGKSTMMNCLMGIYQPTSGTIIFDGVERKNYTPKDSLEFGISMIQQELSPMQDRSIMANIWLGREPVNRLGLIDWKKMYKDTKAVLDIIELDEDPKTLMRHLTVAKMQMVEIARAVSYNSKLIIMDEPSSAITEKETHQLFKIIRQLKSEGRSIIYISHKLDEIKEITDRVSVYRDGTYVSSANTAEITQDQIIEMMVGRSVENLFPKVHVPIGDVVLEVKNLSHETLFHDVSFTVRQGEIFGLNGLVGAGRTELMETIFGLRPRKSGTVIFKGKEFNPKCGKDSIDAGMAFITEDRRGNGIFPIQDIEFNSTLANIDAYEGAGKLLDLKKMNQDCLEYIDKIAIKTPSHRQLIKNLSGGNQQKVLVARWLMTAPDIIIMDEPTRGIDVGAKAEIHRLIGELVKMGKSVIMISSELPEVMGMSDRIMVMHEGEVMGIVDNDETVTAEQLMELASGIVKEQA
ncbi:MAG: sugar ABC transporter ATP-binding protein [Lachnospiraceae bacterium]|nr:sugar ABC transporter ATP-binding protein [Lachnospiraceae bacterium]